MKDVRDNNSISPELVRFIDEAPIDGRDLEDGTYKPARLSVPEVSDIVDTEVRPASTDEDDDDDAVEMKSGTAVSGNESGWYEVEFEESFGGITDRPVVTATAVHRVGDFDTAQFEPPTLEIELVDLIGLGDISVGDVDVGSIDLGNISIDPPRVSERQIDHDVDITSGRIDIDVPNIDGDFDIRDFDIDVGADIRDIDIDDDFSLGSAFDADQLRNEFQSIGDWSFEDALREATRDTGEELYDAGADAFTVLPSTPDVSGTMTSAWDDIMQITYGKGSSTYSGTGWVEWIWVQVGREIDDVLESEFGNRLFDQGRISDAVEDEFIRMNDDIFNMFIDFQDTVDAEVNSLVRDVVDEVEVLQGDTDAGFTDVTQAVEDAQADFALSVEDSLADLVSDIQNEVETFGDGIEDSLIDMDVAIEDIEFELEDLSAEVGDELDLLGEDINDGFDIISEDINNELNAIVEDIEFDVNDSLEDIEVGVNAEIDGIEEEVNATLADLNDNMEDVERRVNTALTDVTALAESAINDSLELLYSTMGMPKGELMVPVQIRNVSNESFEYLGYEGGTEINWTAVGRTEGTIEVEDPDDIVDRVIDRIIERDDIDIQSI